MSLTQSDLQQLEAIFDRKLGPIQGELEALRNDIKEIYSMLANLQKVQEATKDYEKLTLEKQVIKAYTDILSIAKQSGIALPKL